MIANGLGVSEAISDEGMRTVTFWLFAGFIPVALAGWVMSRESVAEELNLRNPLGFQCWYILIRYVSPIAIVLIFLANVSAA